MEQNGDQLLEMYTISVVHSYSSHCQCFYKSQRNDYFIPYHCEHVQISRSKSEREREIAREREEERDEAIK